MQSLKAFARKILPPGVRKPIRRALSAVTGVAQVLAAPVIVALRPRRPSSWPHFVAVRLGISDDPVIRDLVRQTEGLDGDIVECGIWKGRSVSGIALLLEELGSARRVHGFDSFEGLPDPTDADRAADAHPTKHDLQDNLGLIRRGRFADTSLEGVQAKLDRLGVGARVTLYKGFFEDTLPGFESGPLSFVHLDVDLYESYATCLNTLYERVLPGGYLLFDEYTKWAYPGARKAIDEFFADKPETLVPCAGGRAYAQKQ